MFKRTPSVSLALIHQVHRAACSPGTTAGKSNNLATLTATLGTAASCREGNRLNHGPYLVSHFYHVSNTFVSDFDNFRFSHDDL